MTWRTLLWHLKKMAREDSALDQPFPLTDLLAHLAVLGHQEAAELYCQLGPPREFPSPSLN